MTRKLTNKDALTVDEDSAEVKEYRQIAEEVNEFSKAFETAYNAGTYIFSIE